MRDIDLSLLAPAAILLLSAFILPVVMPYITHQGIRAFAATGLVGVAIVSLFFLPLTVGPDVTGEGLQPLSAWNFSAPDSGAGLKVRIDTLSLPFLLVALLVLLAGTLLFSDLSITKQRSWNTVSGWLAMGAGACLLFVSANGLTLLYAIVFFDGCVGLYWLGKGYSNFGVARLFLGVLTGAGLMLTTLVPTIGPISGILLLGVALWLRLGVYPFMETSAHTHWDHDERLVYLGLSLAVAIYLTIRVIKETLPEIIQWLIVGMMLLVGILTWLTQTDTISQDDTVDSEVEPVKEKRALLLVGLILTESLLILLVGPLDAGVSVAFAAGLVLSLVALGVTPALGRPRLGEPAWSWPYLPAVVATLNLIGLPLLLGWPARTTIYQALFDLDNTLIMLMVIVAEAFAFSALVRYWLILGQGQETGGRRSVVGIVAMVPFLTPVLAPFMLSALTKTDLSVPGDELGSGIWLISLIIVAAAGSLGYFRNRIITGLKIPVERVATFIRLNWLFGWGESQFDQVGKALLRGRVTLEGQHYLGWAIFIALIGALIILLR